MIRTVGKYVKRERIASGVSVEEICSQMGIDSTIYFVVEHGDGYIEGLKDIEKLAKILDCQTSDIAHFIPEERELWNTNRQK